MRERPHNYIPGDYLMVCDECGGVFRRSEVRERWDKAMVCRNDWEPRHQQEELRGKADRIAVPVARPEGTDNVTPPAMASIRLEDAQLMLKEDGTTAYVEGLII